MHWYVAQTKPNAERAALARIDNQGFKVYLPQKTKSSRLRHGGTLTRFEPLFPGYLFAAFDLDARWQAINYTRGVIGLLPEKAAPLPLPAGAVEELMAREDGGEFRWPSMVKIAAGARLRLESGPFWGHLGSCLERKGERIKMLIALLGQTIRVEASLSDVSVVEN